MNKTKNCADKEIETCVSASEWLLKFVAIDFEKDCLKKICRGYGQSPPMKSVTQTWYY